MKPHQMYQINFWGNDEYIRVWKTDQRENMIVVNNDTTYKWVHSPDWFKNKKNSNNVPYHVMREQYTSVNYVVTADAKHGYGYIGMNDAELVQQKLVNNLEEGKKYTIRMYVRPVHKTYGMGIYSGYYNPVAYGWSNGVTLRVWIAKDKIKYQHNDSDDDCTEDNDFFSTPLVDKIEILNTSLSLSDFTENISDNGNVSPYGVYAWKKIFATFTAPDIGPLEENYNWVVVEIAGNNTPNPCNAYLLIDNVFLSRGCQVACSRTDCIINPTITGTLMSANSSFKVSNLNNIKKAILKITDIPGQTTYYSKTITCDNGIEGNLYWKGTTNSGGQVAPSFYLYELILENDCGTQIFSNKIVKNSDFTGISNDFDCNEYNISTPEPCCYYQPDIYINNTTIGNPGTIGQLNYSAVNNIYIGSNVTIENDANVLFQAGNEIIGDFQSVEIGSNVTAEIIQCPPGKKEDDDDDKTETIDATILPDVSAVSFKLDSTVKEVSNLKSENLESEIFHLYPNPTSGTLQMDYRLQENETGELIIYDITGRKVKRFLLTNQNNTLKIQEPELKNGVYLYQVIVNNEMRVSEKLVVIK